MKKYILLALFMLAFIFNVFCQVVTRPMRDGMHILMVDGKVCIHPEKCFWRELDALIDGTIVPLGSKYSGTITYNDTENITLSAGNSLDANSYITVKKHGIIHDKAKEIFDAYWMVQVNDNDVVIYPDGEGKLNINNIPVLYEKGTIRIQRILRQVIPDHEFSDKYSMVQYGSNIITISYTNPTFNINDISFCQGDVSLDVSLNGAFNNVSEIRWIVENDKGQKIYDYAGKETDNIDLDNFPAGLYIVYCRITVPDYGFIYIKPKAFEIKPQLKNTESYLYTDNVKLGSSAELCSEYPNAVHFSARFTGAQQGDTYKVYQKIGNDSVLVEGISKRTYSDVAVIMQQRKPG